MIIQLNTFNRTHYYDTDVMNIVKLNYSSEYKSLYVTYSIKTDMNFGVYTEEHRLDNDAQFDEFFKQWKQSKEKK